MNLARENILRRVAKFSLTHYRALILATLILGGISGFLVNRLQLQSDVVNLLPTNVPKTGAFVKFFKEFGAADSLFIVLERRNGGEVESFGPLAEALAQRLMESGEFSEIQGRVDRDAVEKVATQFVSKALLYLTEDDLREMETRLSDRAIESQVRELKARLYSPLGSLSSQWAARDPLDLWPIFRRHIPVDLMSFGMDSSGTLLSDDRKMMLLIARPKGPPSDVAYDEMLLKKVHVAIRNAKESFARGKNISPEDSFRDLQIGITGGHISALEDSRMIKKELGQNFSISLIGVLAIFVLAFRRGISILYALFPLMVSPLLTLGLLSPLIGRLSESTGAFSAIILGLSIDFVILLYSRYLEESNQGLGTPEALEKSLSFTGPGVFTGAVTTGIAYYALLYSDFRGIRELGLLTGTGILISLACAFFLFPALVAWRERGKPKEKPSGAIFAFGLGRLCSWARRRPSWVLCLCAAATICTTLWAFHVRLNNDPKRLRPTQRPSLALEERVQEKMGEGLETIVVLASSRGPEETLEIQGRLKDQFEKAMASGLPIARYENLAVFIPPLSQQKRNLEWIETRRKEAFDPGRVEKKLREALQREGLRVESFEPGLKFLHELLANREALEFKHFQQLPSMAVGRFIKRSGEDFISASYLHIKPGYWADPRTKVFLESLKGAGLNVQVTGPKLVQMELEDLMTGEAWKILLIALAGVFGLIYFDFRSWRLSLLSLLPVVLASIWTLGLMGIWGMDLNFMNLVVFTMVLGVGVDYSVHILHRWSESKTARWETGLSQVGKGVVLAALTTLVSFGSLILSEYPGLQSMGAVALMGIGFSALLALTLLPAILQKSPKNRST
jgi:predicted RND superfamily exporter protein